MANPRQDERLQQINQQNQESARRAAEEAARAGQATAEEASRMGRAAADAGERVTRAGADVLQRNAETFQQLWQSGLDMARQMAERSVDQFARACGLSGDSGQRAAEQSSRNVTAMITSGTVVAQTLQDMSREWFDFSRQRMEQNLQQFNSLMRCRTPQDLVAAQSDLVRDNFEGLMQSSRKMAEMSMHMAEEAGRKMAENTRRAA